MIKDGKYLEDRSVALIKLEVDVLTVADEGKFVHRIGVGSEEIEGTKIFVGPTVFNQSHTVNGAATFTGTVGMSGAVNISGDVVMSGRVHMTGEVTQVNSIDLNISDNVIVVNSGESGAGITKGFSGVKVDRGTLLPYLIGFRESDDKLVAGLAVSPDSVDYSTLKRIAFVDDLNFTIPALNGDITGSLEANTVAKIQAKPVSAANPANASVLYYDGTSWVPVKVSDLLPPADIGEGSGLIAMNSSMTPAGGFAGAGEPMPYRQITFTPGLPAGTDYTVIITPIENTQAKVGEVWWEKANAPTEVQNTFRIYNTGDSGVSFKWGVFAVGMPVGTAPGTDIAGNYSSDIKVVGLRGKEIDVSVTNPAPWDILTFDGTKWKALPNSASGSITPTTQASGDVTGTFSALKVQGINGKAIDDLAGRALTPTEGDTLRYNGTKWQVGAHTLAGDVSGEHANTKVNKIKEVPVDLSGAADGKVLTYSNNKFVLGSAAGGGISTSEDPKVYGKYFTLPGTYYWTPPAGVTAVRVIIISGGGAGTTTSSGSGSAVFDFIRDVSQIQYTVIVGHGSGRYVSLSNSTPARASYVLSNVTLYGGETSSFDGIGPFPGLDGFSGLYSVEMQQLYEAWLPPEDLTTAPRYRSHRGGPGGSGSLTRMVGSHHGCTGGGSVFGTYFGGGVSSYEAGNARHEFGGGGGASAGIQMYGGHGGAFGQPGGSTQNTYTTYSSIPRGADGGFPGGGGGAATSGYDNINGRTAYGKGGAGGNGAVIILWGAAIL